MSNYVFNFEEGGIEQKLLLGGKGASLAEMSKIGLPVPEGFTITTKGCLNYYEVGKKISDEIEKEIFDHLRILEGKTGKKLGDINDPLLVSVRSGAAISMPGMMDTVLNLGLNDESVKGLAKLTDNTCFALDCYRRFIQMFGDVVLGIHKYKFDEIMREAVGKSADKSTELSEEEYAKIIEAFKAKFKNEVGFDFPQEPEKQLMMSIEAVFDSWNNDRAKIYRRANEISDDLGTAVNVQSMVFGNMGDTSGTGVAFTRNPANGENKVFGEFLMNAQGEDVVAGIRTPKEIDELKQVMPKAYDEFIKATKILENHYRDVQDIEFTIEREKLYFLQTRTAKRTADAAINIAVEMVEEGFITTDEAIMRIQPEQINQLLHPEFIETELENAKIMAKGLPASPGAATGKVYFNSEDVVKAKDAGISSILLRTETSPEDITGMIQAEGILTARGGMTSHAAVVARGMGKCCIAGCGEITVNESEKYFIIDGEKYYEGHSISLNGNTGFVYDGKIKTKEHELTGNFGKLMSWVDERRKMKVRTNADNARDSAVANKFGAEGIGLCRTEHMFFEAERIISVRKMIVADNKEERVKALAELLPYQVEDFKGIYEEMKEKPVTIRLLDPPLHEFLPKEEEGVEVLAERLNVKVADLKDKIALLSEFNPMLGHRGCRLAITYPEIYEMQVEAIMIAAIEVSKANDFDIEPEIMVPLVGHVGEMTIVKKLIEDIAEEVIAKFDYKLIYHIGTMIEIPRAALIADEIAEHAEFFSFGTNDLTQMALGFSRDDAGKFIEEYRDQKVLPYDPFERIDFKGVGKLMKIAVEGGKSTKKDLKMGICGEHGGESESVKYCHELGLNYVSCSPYRVPIAKIAAAQAVIEDEK
ncbi:pyruvate, phosphate dikinase [Clostridiaceae bacterium HSG29]|nr:pyruvate, phosphate dikinase [Clostridiaceae bacterium HSG29]